MITHELIDEALAKAGPYAPHLPSELAAFAPEESSPQAPSYFAELKRLFDGAA